MILITVGTQLPFDRLIKYVDSYSNSLNDEIIAQTGNGTYIPKNFASKSFYPPDEMDLLFEKSNLIISHAGMGTIINALKAKKSLIVVPRLSNLGEHRNNHQLDTVKSITGLEGVHIATSKDELYALLDERHILKCSRGLKTPERESLCRYLIDLLN